MDPFKFDYKCQKHYNYRIEYIYVKSINESFKDIFCCNECFNEDLDLNINDYQHINYLIDDTDKIFLKFPPTKIQQILQQLIKVTNKDDTVDLIKERISQFFNKLKVSVNEEIENRHKQMLIMAEGLNLQNNRETIIQKYQEISRILELKQCLIDRNTNLQEKQEQYSQLTNELHSQIEQNTEKLQELLLDHCQNFIFNLDSARRLQESILQSIKEINLLIKPYFNHQVDTELFKTDFGSTQVASSITYNQNKQQQVKQILDKTFTNIVSDIILNPNYKYVFKFRIQNLDQGTNVNLGIVFNRNIHTVKGLEDKLCCNLGLQNSLVSKQYNFGIFKPLRGELFQLSCHNEVELRVCIKDQLLQVVDYPNYSYKLGLEDIHISKLDPEEQFRLYVGLYYYNTTVVFLGGQIVSDFNSN